MPEKPKTIPIFEAVEIIESSAPGAGLRPVQARGLRERAIKIVDTGVDVLSENMANFIEGVSEMLSAGAKMAGPFGIEAVEVECHVSGTGKIGFPGTGLDLQGGSTLKITFKPKP